MAEHGGPTFGNVSIAGSVNQKNRKMANHGLYSQTSRSRSRDRSRSYQQGVDSRSSPGLLDQSHSTPHHFTAPQREPSLTRGKAPSSESHSSDRSESPGGLLKMPRALERARRWWFAYANTCGVLSIMYLFSCLFQGFSRICRYVGLRVCLLIFLCAVAAIVRLCLLFRWKEQHLKQLETTRLREQQQLVDAKGELAEAEARAKEYVERLDEQGMQMRRLQEADPSTCKICFERSPSCTLLPCKHHAFCTVCAWEVRGNQHDARCPLCRVVIENIIETYDA